MKAPPHGPSLWPHLVTQHSVLWPQHCPSLCPAHPPALLPDSVSQSSSRLPRPQHPGLMSEAPSALSFASVQGLCWCTVGSSKSPPPPHPHSALSAQHRHPVNTLSSLTADLVSEKNWNYELLSPHSLEEGITIYPTPLQIGTGQNRGSYPRIGVGPHFWTCCVAVTMLIPGSEVGALGWEAGTWDMACHWL